MPRKNSPYARAKAHDPDALNEIEAQVMVQLGRMTQEECDRLFPQVDERLERGLQGFRDAIATAMLELRVKRRLSQREFGTLIGLTQSAVSEMETLCFTPNPIQLAKFAYRLEVPLIVEIGDQRAELRFPPEVPLLNRSFCTEEEPCGHCTECVW